MLKNEAQIEKNNIEKIKYNNNYLNSYNNKFIKEKLSIRIFRLIVNTIILIILIATLSYAFATYNPQWRIFFFLTSWSFCMNFIYILSVTIIDLFSLTCKIYFLHYNNLIRNYYIRICTPFGITSVFVYWELVLFGKNFQKTGDVYDVCESIYLNGIILLFLFFDMFASPHIYKNNRIPDIMVLTILIIFYYIILSLGKYLDIFQPYEFMIRSDVRQIIGVGIIVYVLLLNGYIVFDLLAEHFFEEENTKKPTPKSVVEDIIENSSRQALYNSNNETVMDHSINLNEVTTHLKHISIANENKKIKNDLNKNYETQNNNKIFEKK